jgi:hypothetical protein
MIIAKKNANALIAERITNMTEPFHISALVNDPIPPSPVVEGVKSQ